MQIQENEKYITNFHKWEINKKKIQALKNYAQTFDAFSDWLSLELAARFFETSYQDPEIEMFLEYLLRKNQINYLDWCYKNRWVKAQFYRSSEPCQQQFFFPDTEKQRRKSFMDAPFYLQIDPFKTQTMRTI
jgi:hypothetical protein